MPLHDKDGICVEKPNFLGLLLSVQDEIREKTRWDLNFAENYGVV